MFKFKGYCVDGPHQNKQVTCVKDRFVAEIPLKEVVAWSPFEPQSLQPIATVQYRWFKIPGMQRGYWSCDPRRAYDPFCGI